jgi:hypothetical protein
MPRYFLIPVVLLALALAGCCGCPDGNAAPHRVFDMIGDIPAPLPAPPLATEGK